MYSPPLPRELYDATALKPFNARLFCYTVDTKWLSLFRYSPHGVCSVTLSRERWGAVKVEQLKWVPGIRVHSDSHEKTLILSRALLMTDTKALPFTVALFSSSATSSVSLTIKDMANDPD